MITNADFTQLHNHSEYSKFDGLAKMGELVLQARKMGFKSLAITDHGNVGGWIKFYQECKKKKDKNDKPLLDAKGNPLAPLKPILGCEFYLARHHEKHEKQFQPDGRKGNRHILLLAKNQIGYQNLCALSQRSWTHGQLYDPRVDLELLAKHSEGVICSSACLSSVINNNLLHGRYAQALSVARVLKDIYGKDFFLEVMYHGIDAQGFIIPDIIRLGMALDVPIFASNDCHCVFKHQADSQNLLMAMSQSRCLKDAKLLKHSYGEFYLKSAEEMSKMFGTRPDFLLNTNMVVERVDDYLKLGGMRLPHFDVSNARISLGEKYFKDIENGNIEAISKDVKHQQSSSEKFEEAYKFMSELIDVGMKRLGWDKSPEHMEVLRKEMGDVRVAWEANQMDFATYFLIVWDYINFARSKGIVTGCGRGSGYASVILRALRICFGPCPVKHGLLWERFISFDWKYALMDSDWGFGNVITDTEVLENTDDIDDDRDVEQDQGGTDRY